MKQKPTYYSVKVWLTTLLASPVLLFIFIVCIDKPTIERIVDISFVLVYFAIVIFTLFASSIGWLIFRGMEWLAYKTLPDTQLIKSLLCIGVQLIIASTIAGLFILLDNPRSFDPSLFYIAIPYGIVAGFSVWYYELEPGSAPPAEPSYEDMAQAEQV